MKRRKPPPCTKAVQSDRTFENGCGGFWAKSSGFARAVFQNLVEPGHKNGNGGGGGQNIAHRLGQEHRKHLVVWHEQGQDEDEGNEQDEFALTGQQQADLRLAQGHKSLLAKMPTM